MKTPTRRPADPMKAAEDVFKRVPRPAPAPMGRSAQVPRARETVSLPIDGDVLEHFQSDGQGWKERINAALRTAAGLDGDATPGRRPEDLNATNDD